MNEREIARKLGVWNQQADRVLARLATFREANESLEAEIRKVYPIGRKVRVVLGREKVLGTVAMYILPLDGGLVVAVPRADFARCPDSFKPKIVDGSTFCRIVRPWSCIEGPAYDDN